MVTDTRPLQPGDANHRPEAHPATSFSPSPDETAIKTYRYLRIGMVGVVLALFVSILVERSDVAGWQTSISSYYYTPVRAVFVGGMIAIGIALVSIKGSTRWEDIWFNFAGIMAPAVAVIPTSDVGDFWSVDLVASPRNDDGTLADWVVANIANNTESLLIAAFAGMTVAFVLTAINNPSKSQFRSAGTPELRWGMVVTFGLLLAITGAYLWWDGFNERAHGFAAVAMFVFLAFGIAANALHRRGKSEKRTYFRIYSAIAVAMLASGLLFLTDWTHKILILEAVEIALFATFWIVQTRELWDETTYSPAAA